MNHVMYALCIIGFALNVRELPELLSFIQSMDVRFWRLQTVIPAGRARECREIQIGQGDMRTLGAFIRRNSTPAAKAGVRIICGDGLMYVEEPRSDGKPWRGCAAGIVTCGITRDGKVKGCLSMGDELLEGDVRKEDLWRIWFRPGAFSYNRWFDASHLGPNCAACEKGEECLGGCSANSRAATGRFHNDPYCHYRLTAKTESAPPPIRRSVVMK